MSVFDVVDSYTNWPASKFHEPREVEDGIQLKKTVKELSNWWSHRWLRILDEFGLGVRWERAKLYASRGQVISIEIENGLVRASVQGSASEPYRVMITVKTIPKPVWMAVLRDLCRTSSFAIAMASALLPAEEQISKVFQENGVMLFPDRQGELHTKCTCLDWSNPCKHIAAVYLLLAAEFDRDPFLLFKLRGLEQNDFYELSRPENSVTERLGEDETKVASSLGQEHDDQRRETHIHPNIIPYLVNSEGGLAHEAASPGFSISDGALEECEKSYDNLNSFWKYCIDDAQILGKWNLPQQSASLPISLGDFPFWQGNENLLDQIHIAYESAPEHAKVALGKRL